VKKEVSFVKDLSSPSKRVTVLKLISQLTSSPDFDILGNENVFSVFSDTRVYTWSYSKEDILAIINTSKQKFNKK
jgi:hypothetical protein